MKRQRVIAHLDMDAFFAAVEQRDNPRLRGQPVIIGADPKKGKGRGVVATCSYEARPFGIHSAMPISVAYRLCPQGIFLRGSHQKYREASHQIFNILYDFTPDIQPISIDEAFLDITGSYHFYQTPLNTCQTIKNRIKKEIGLNASVGIAPNKMTAKIASDYCKPDGLLEIKPEKVLQFLWALPVGKLWGVGKQTQQRLHKLNIKTISDIAHSSQETLYESFGEHGLHLYALSHGIDDREVAVDDEIKSVSHEHTFDVDTADLELIYHELSNLSEKVSRRLRKYKLKGKTLSVKIRTTGFKTFTRAHTFSDRTNYFENIYKESKKLFDGFFHSPMKCRLIGIRVSNFVEPYFQDNLFTDEKEEIKEKVHQALDAIKDKFGESAIHRGM